MITAALLIFGRPRVKNEPSEVDRSLHVIDCWQVERRAPCVRMSDGYGPDGHQTIRFSNEKRPSSGWSYF